MISLSRFFITALLVAAPGCLDAQGFLSRIFSRKAELERRLVDIRDDKVKWNATKAHIWLFEHCDEKDDTRIMNEYHRTDQQGRTVLGDLIMGGLVTPDSEFIKKVVADSTAPERNEDSEEGEPRYLISDFPDFFVTNFDQLKPFVPVLFQKGDLATQTAITRGLVEMNELDKYRKLYSDPILQSFTFNLRDDEVNGNALNAAFALLLLGERARPALLLAKASDDFQCRYVARHLILYLDGKLSDEELAARLDGDDHPGAIWLNLETIKDKHMPTGREGAIWIVGN